jgi:hypothetical protein
MLDDALPALPCDSARHPRPARTATGETLLRRRPSGPASLMALTLCALLAACGGGDPQTERPPATTQATPDSRLAGSPTETGLAEQAIDDQHDAAATRRPLPRLELTRPAQRRVLSGHEAVEALGEHLPAVAAHHGFTPERLRRVLLRDPTSRITHHGRLQYDEPLMPAPAQAPWIEPGGVTARLAQIAHGATSEAADPDADIQVAPLHQTFKLHSKPGSKRTLHLEFRGMVMRDTLWNFASDRAEIVARPYDFDGN